MNQPWNSTELASWWFTAVCYLYAVTCCHLFCGHFVPFRPVSFWSGRQCEIYARGWALLPVAQKRNICIPKFLWLFWYSFASEIEFRSFAWGGHLFHHGAGTGGKPCRLRSALRHKYPRAQSTRSTFQDIAKPPVLHLYHLSCRTIMNDYDVINM
jgi:hypothetical protein